MSYRPPRCCAAARLTKPQQPDTPTAMPPPRQLLLQRRDGRSDLIAFGHMQARRLILNSLPIIPPRHPRCWSHCFSRPATDRTPCQHPSTPTRREASRYLSPHGTWKRHCVPSFISASCTQLCRLLSPTSVLHSDRDVLTKVPSGAFLSSPSAAFASGVICAERATDAADPTVRHNGATPPAKREHGRNAQVRLRGGAGIQRASLTMALRSSSEMSL